MIFTNCVVCGHPFIVELDEQYLPMLKQGKQLIERIECEECGAENFIEHRRFGGVTMDRETVESKGLKKLKK